LIAIQSLADCVVRAVTEDGTMPLNDARVRRRIVEVMLEDLQYLAGSPERSPAPNLKSPLWRIQEPQYRQHLLVSHKRGMMAGLQVWYACDARMTRHQVVNASPIVAAALRAKEQQGWSLQFFQ
jgi:hypothetical protein